MSRQQWRYSRWSSFPWRRTAAGRHARSAYGRQWPAGNSAPKYWHIRQRSYGHVPAVHPQKVWLSETKVTEYVVVAVFAAAAALALNLWMNMIKVLILNLFV